MTVSPHVNMTTGADISCTRLRKVFRDIANNRGVVGLGDFNLEIAPSEFVTIIGPSGCGKTTFLNIVAGFERQTSGEILVGGKPVTAPGPDRGVVFQEYALFPWLTVTRNVGYGLLERGMSRKEADGEADRWLKLVGLEEFGSRYPHELSGGMRQRVALIRVLAADPAILLMDEPFAALDALTRTALQRELQAIWQQARKTVIFVTHNVDEAIFLGDRMVIMSARPSSVKSIVTIDLPRPRDTTDEKFNEYRRLASRELEQELTSMIRFR